MMSHTGELGGLKKLSRTRSLTGIGGSSTLTDNAAKDGAGPPPSAPVSARSEADILEPTSTSSNESLCQIALTPSGPGSTSSTRTVSTSIPDPQNTIPDIVSIEATPRPASDSDLEPPENHRVFPKDDHLDSGLTQKGVQKLGRIAGSISKLLRIDSRTGSPFGKKSSRDSEDRPVSARLEDENRTGSALVRVGGSSTDVFAPRTKLPVPQLPLHKSTSSLIRSPISDRPTSAPRTHQKSDSLSLSARSVDDDPPSPGSLRASSGGISNGVIVMNRPIKPGSSRQFLADAVHGTEEPEIVQRRRVINELLSTERDYVRDLVIIREYFLLPLKTNKLLPEPLIGQIFSNIATILNVNKVLLKELTENAEKDDGNSIGSCFKQLVDYLKIYSGYSNNQATSAATLKQQIRDNEKFRVWLQEQQMTPECQRNELSSYLIKPVQRLCKYPLLIRELLKHTPPGHPDRKDLEEVYAKVEAVVAGVEDARKRMDVAVQMIELRSRIVGADIDIVTPTRHLVREGPLRYSFHTKEKLQLGFLMLFNDLLLLTQPKDENNFQTHLKFKLAQPLSSLIINELPPVFDDGSKESYWKYRFELHFKNAEDRFERLLLATELAETRDSWTNDLKKYMWADVKASGRSPRP